MLGHRRRGPGAPVGRGDRLARVPRLDHEVVGDLLAERRQRLLAREVLDALAGGRDRDVVDVADLGQLLQDQVAAAVAVKEGGGRSMTGEFGHGVGDVGALDRHDVLDAVAEQGEDVGTTLDDDDRIALGDPRPGGEPLVGRDVAGAGALANRVDDLGRTHRALLERAEQRLRALDHRPAFRGSNVLDPLDRDRRATRPDAFDGFERCTEDRGLDLVEPARDRDTAERLAVLGVDADVDPADLRGLLEPPQVEVVAEEPLGLPEDRADDVVPFDHPLGGHVRVNQVFVCVLHE